MNPEEREEAAAAEAADQMARRGVKVNSSKSRFVKQAVEKQQFLENADAAIDADQSRKQQAVALINKFWQITKSTKLAENKGPTEKSVEAQLVRDLVLFANDLNNDPNEIEGSGSVAIITLLLKTVMNMRDQQNDLAYKIFKLEQQIKTSSNQATPLSNDKS